MSKPIIFVAALLNNIVLLPLGCDVFSEISDFSKNYSIFLGRWSFRVTGLSTKMLSCKSFPGKSLLQCLFVYLSKFSGRFHLSLSRFGTTRKLLLSVYSSLLISETSSSLSAWSLCFFEGFSVVASMAENLDGRCLVSPCLVFSTSASLAKLVYLVPLNYFMKKNPLSA